MNQEPSPGYYPLLDTLRLYAGWLLASLIAVFAVGSYQQLHTFPWRFSILDEWVESALIVQSIFVTFLFLLLSSIHRAIGKGLWKGVLLTMIGFVLFVMFRVNT